MLRIRSTVPPFAPPNPPHLLPAPLSSPGRNRSPDAAEAPGEAPGPLGVAGRTGVANQRTADAAEAGDPSDHAAGRGERAETGRWERPVRWERGVRRCASWVKPVLLGAPSKGPGIEMMVLWSLDEKAFFVCWVIESFFFPLETDTFSSFTDEAHPGESPRSR